MDVHNATYMVFAIKRNIYKYGKSSIIYCRSVAFPVQRGENEIHLATANIGITVEIVNFLNIYCTDVAKTK